MILFSDINSCCGRNPTGGARGVKERLFVEAPFFWRKRRRAPAGKMGDNGAHGAAACPYEVLARLYTPWVPSNPLHESCSAPRPRTSRCWCDLGASNPRRQIACGPSSATRPPHHPHVAPTAADVSSTTNSTLGRQLVGISLPAGPPDCQHRRSSPLLYEAIYA